MIALDQGGARFNTRVAAVFVDAGAVLLTRAERDDFWTLPGGRLEMRETTGDALRREMREEMGVDVRLERLLWIVENFFAYDGREYHELSFVYLASGPRHSDAFDITDGGMRIRFEWHALETAPALRVLPSFLRQGLCALPAQVQHIVHRDT